MFSGDTGTRYWQSRAGQEPMWQRQLFHGHLGSQYHSLCNAVRETVANRSGYTLAALHTAESVVGAMIASLLTQSGLSRHIGNVKFMAFAVGTLTFHIATLCFIRSFLRQHQIGWSESVRFFRWITAPAPGAGEFGLPHRPANRLDVGRAVGSSLDSNPY